MEIRTLANEYSAAKINDLTYSPEKVDEYYNQNKKDFYEVSFQTFDITADMMENADSALADCEAAAKEMAESITDVESFNELCKEYVSEDRHHYYDNGAITFNRDKVRAEVAEESADWLFSDDRKPGDTTYIAFETEEKTGYHVLHFVEKTDMNYKVVSYHQILIETTSDNEDILAAAEAEAMDILNEFQNADAEKKTENGFLSLISQYSQASSSASSYNGSYTNARHGAISNEFDQWLFDKERQAGDVAVLKSEQGYHVVYFSGHGDTYYNYKITEKMRSIDFNAWVNGILENTNIKITDFAAKMVNRY
jgi:parvulin-like peptidyl-prolyl isomerase